MPRRLTSENTGCTPASSSARLYQAARFGVDSMQMAAGPQDAADLVQRGVRVDEVLDHLAEQHGVGASVGRTAARRR